MALLYSCLSQTGEQATVSASSGTIASQTYLQLNVPPANTCPKVKKIQFKCSSHDQGFAGDNVSYSWGDLIVTATDGTEIYKQSRAFCNAVADSNFQLHFGSYGEEDELVQKCAPGSILVLVLNAQYPAWSNTARAAELKIEY